jgi:hypothetical protein
MIRNRLRIFDDDQVQQQLNYLLTLVPMVVMTIVMAMNW